MARKKTSYVRLAAARNDQTIHLDFPTDALNAMDMTRHELKARGFDVEQALPVQLFTDASEAIQMAELFTR